MGFNLVESTIKLRAAFALSEKYISSKNSVRNNCKWHLNAMA